MPASFCLASVDVGSNAARLLISDVTWQQNTLRTNKVAFYRLPLQLGNEVFTHGFLSKEKKESLVHALTAFHALIQVFKPNAYLACATAALREAENTHGILQTLSESGFTLHVITGEIESALIGLATASFGPADKLAVTIDVGGGSTELSLRHPHGVIAGNSFQIGTLRLLQHWVEDTAWLQLKSYIASEISPYPNTLIGTGGNINKVPSLLQKKTPAYVSKKNLSNLIDLLEPLSIPERCRRFGLKPDRAEVLLPALRIYTNILKWNKTNKLLIPKTGLSDAVILLLAKELFGELLPWEADLLQQIRKS